MPGRKTLGAVGASSTTMPVTPTKPEGCVLDGIERVQQGLGAVWVQGGGFYGRECQRTVFLAVAKMVGHVKGKVMGVSACRFVLHGAGNLAGPVPRESSQTSEASKLRSQTFIMKPFWPSGPNPASNKSYQDCRVPLPELPIIPNVSQLGTERSRGVSQGSFELTY